MDRKSPSFPADLVQTHPGLGLLRLAALIAEGGAADEDTLDEMFEQMETGAFDALPAQEMWPEIARGLMASAPQAMIGALRESGVLGIVLPEVAALFGVPQIADAPAEVDLGAHLLASLAEAARRNAPLEVRFALLTMNVGKADSPREHLPVHYRHQERGAPRIIAIGARFGVPDACRELALLAIAECERVHRASEIRAGPVAAMLSRLGAFGDPGRFALLMQVCTCDYFAYGGRGEAAYPKAALLERALKACAAVDGAAEDVDMARAGAIAGAFRSERWSGEGD